MIETELNKEELLDLILNNLKDINLPYYNELKEYYSLKNKRIFLKSLLTITNNKINNNLTEQIELLLKLEQKEEEEKNNLIDSNSIEAISIINNIQIKIWKGDITKLKIDSIVNAANSALLGCFRINHPCIDNAIHCAAGPGLRNECIDFMESRNDEPFPVGIAYLTHGYALPSKYVLHCVGPAAKYQGHEQPNELKSCYISCLDTAIQSGIRSIAFCCISTGIFGYPQESACQLALQTVYEWIQNHPNQLDHIVFNVFTEKDWQIYNHYARIILPQI